MHPFTCTRAVAAPRPWPRLAGQRKQRHMTTRPRPSRKHKEQKGEVDTPGKALAGAASTAPARALPGQLAQCQQSAPPLSPRVPTLSTTLEPRLGRHLHGGMQIFEKIIGTQDQMRTKRRRSSGRSLPRKSTKPPARSLPGTTAMLRQDPCRDPGKTLAEDISWAMTRPASTKTPPPFPCRYRLSELGEHLHGDVWPLD